MATKKGNHWVYKKDKKNGYTPKFFGVGLVVCFMLLFVGMGVASATDYYVSLSGKNSNDGTTLDTAWQTITYAATKAQAGDIVHIKGGNYGHEHVVIKNSGTAAKPIVFEGSDGTPVINGQDETGNGIHIYNKDYITLRNIKVTKYHCDIWVQNAEYIVLDNLIADTSGEAGIVLLEASHCTIQNSIARDARELAIALWKSDYNLIEDCSVESIRADSSDFQLSTDYYFVLFYAHDNTIQNCTARNYHGAVENTHPGHGFGIKADPPYSGAHSYNNKFIDCTSYAVQEGLCVSDWAYDNEFINCKAYRDDLIQDSWGLVIRDGAYNNTFKDCVVDGYRRGITIQESGRCPYPAIPENNILLNCIISDSQDAMKVPHSENNRIENCVITDASRLFNTGSVETLKNCIITDISSWGSGNPTITYSDFWNNGFSKPSGTGNMNADPLFVDPANGDYHLKPGSRCIGAGEGGVDMGAYPEDESKDVGTISGTVTDGTNPIQGAAVTADGYSDQTDSNGYYEITNVQVGPYTVTASATGYHRESQEDVPVSKDQTTTVDFQLTEAPSLVANWQFEEGEGTTTHDSSDYGNDGTITGAAYTTSSKIGDYALEFDGLDDYVEIQDYASLDITDAVTVVAWIKPDTVDSQCSVLGKQDAYTFKTSGSEIEFTTPGKKDHTSTGAGLVTGSWQHVAVVFVADDEARFYKDGAFISSDSASTMSSSEYPLLIGNNQWNERFSGSIDEVKIYNRALSAEEIRREYEAGFKIPNYDVNEDGTVDISDTTIVGQHIGETTNPPYPRYDVNEDGLVDDLDISIVDQHFCEITS